MNEASNIRFAPDPNRRLESQSSSFASAWASGRRPVIEDYLAGSREDEAPVLLRRLVRLDIFYRRQSGEHPRADDYSRFPGLDPQWLTDEIQLSSYLRPPAEGGDVAATGTLRRNESTPRVQRFCCPHCCFVISSSDVNTDGGELLCPQCAKSFRVDNLAGESTADDPRRSVGRFRLLERVGSGSYGEVWRAHDTELDRLVALKIPHRKLLVTATDRARIWREAKAAAQLEHAAVVRVYDVVNVDDMPILVSDFISGPTLKDYLKERRLPFRASAALTADIAEALDYAHTRRLVHRDIKPGNIMIRFDSDAARAAANGQAVFPGRAVLVDFGLAIRQEAEIMITADGVLVGTPAYMSPEQARGRAHDVDGRSDIYSLGVVLYELLCGELPFRGSKQMLIHQVLHEEPLPPRRTNEAIPRDLETICLKAMAKEPSRRYATGQEMADDLQSFLEGRPIQARPVGRIEKTWRWGRRNPAIASLLATVAVLLLAGTGVSSYFAVRATQGELRATRGEASALSLAESLRKEKAVSDQRAYNFEFKLAAGDWKQARVALVSQKLRELSPPGPGDPDLRGFEWHYLKRLCRLDIATMTGHKGPVFAVAASPDGTVIASGGADGTIRLWDTARHRQTRALTGHEGAVRALAFLPDGKGLFSAGDDRLVRLWDLDTGEVSRQFAGAVNPISCLALSRDHRKLAAATAGVFFSGNDRRGRPVSGDVLCWDVERGRECFPAAHQSSSVWAIGFNPDDRQLVVGCQNGSLLVLDTATGKTSSDFGGYRRFSRGIAYSPDGRFLAWGESGAQVKVWDITKREQIGVLRAGAIVLTLAFSPDSKRLASAGAGGAVRIWDVDSMWELMNLPGHVGDVNSTGFCSPAGRLIVTGGDDGTVRIWDAITSSEATIVRNGRDLVSAVAFHSSDHLAYAHGGSAVNVCDPASGVHGLSWSLPAGNSTDCLSCSPDGQALATVDQRGNVRVWDSLNGRSLRNFALGEQKLWWATYSPDGKEIAVAVDDGTVRLLDSTTGKENCRLAGHDGGACTVTYQNEGSLVASAGADGTVRLWHPSTGRLLRTIRAHEGTVWGLAFGEHGRVVASAGVDGDVKLWDANSGELLKTLPGHEGGAYRVCFSPDGRRVATGDGVGTVRLWETGSGAELLELSGHTNRVVGLAFSPDGLRLASASYDGTVRVWDGTELSAEHLEWRDARSAVRFLEGKSLPRAEIVATIRAEPTMSESVRDKALALARNEP